MYVSSGHSDEVESVAFSPDGLKIASGSEDNSIKIWNAETGDVIHTLKGDRDKLL
jgi:WD40 repeat protein